jgi:hypothetical protein
MKLSFMLSYYIDSIRMEREGVERNGVEGRMGEVHRVGTLAG